MSKLSFGMQIYYKLLCKSKNKVFNQEELEKIAEFGDRVELKVYDYINETKTI